MLQDLVSVVVLTRDPLQPHVRRCLDALAQSTAEYELILIRRQREWSFASACNQGIRGSMGDYICLMNDDVEVKLDTLERLKETARPPEVGVVGALLLYPNGIIQHAGGFMTKDDPWRFHHYGGYPLGPNLATVGPIHWVTFALVMLRREVLERVGPLDEGLKLAYEDIDYCLRLKQQGYRIAMNFEAQAMHRESYTRGKSMDGGEKESQEYLFDKWGMRKRGKVRNR